ncbi:cupin domain-containing protein [Tomitella gaofuii]|uniref:cupin domain-containing protein n=1 Tax=Tomitella gaofuii TaxID=2760083 RepID=UPI001F32DA12|nr:cupin domain-containing protein [Tomitella gaofuii]
MSEENAATPDDEAQTSDEKAAGSGTAPRILTMADHHGLIDAAEPRATRPGVKRIMVADGARVIVFRFAAGQILAEHKAAFPILVQSIDGHIAFTADGRTVDLHPGDIAHLSARLLHEVRAVTDATLLLTMLDPAATAGEE